MMDQPSGRFQIVDDPQGGPVARADFPKDPRPTLALGEAVQVKGIWFKVLRLKADGKLGLKMLHGTEVAERGLNAAGIP